MFHNTVFRHYEFHVVRISNDTSPLEVCDARNLSDPWLALIGAFRLVQCQSVLGVQAGLFPLLALLNSLCLSFVHPRYCAVRQSGACVTKHSMAFVKSNNGRIKNSMGHCLGVRFYVNRSQTWWRRDRGLTLAQQWVIVGVSSTMSIGPRHCGDLAMD